MCESCGRSVFSQLVAQLSLESYDQQRHSFKDFVESNTVNFVVNERVEKGEQVDAAHMVEQSNAPVMIQGHVA